MSSPHEDDSMEEAKDGSHKHAHKVKGHDHHTAHDKHAHPAAHPHKAPKHEGYDRISGNAHTKEVKKGGHGKGGWGDEEFDKYGKHHSAEQAAGLLEEEVADGQEEEVEHKEETEETKETGERAEDKNEHKEFEMHEKDFPALK
uniref:Hyaluronan/mRNA-binding protein domain-containing protein n=1 Tax=Euplotes harpa TaxID=151035 RepID=A0A7S3JDT0_9SPIT|mmetsp:Transcript_32222/g.36738  ORF Transcript_32222/g.36738 Transcript_32222/m.36738 type:complete len:144 (+) Transcript_32222:49-480(+)|eukprot:CAMPEP_0168334272 /NCGR_PEP_ID=MMETSP0213-20121227/10158_1 /TAXON_ID=151035 /ORGANISM="Euplotes harpa, Strain FSP1.4" /LENGTH=143 /DNA_ID=CAMNT_0008338863 /DNA_START=109 /DNA_END=540 /DNA_ORIENTATION=+